LAFICHASNRKGNGWTLSRSTALSGLSDLIRHFVLNTTIDELKVGKNTKKPSFTKIPYFMNEFVPKVLKHYLCHKKNHVRYTK